MAWAQHWFWGSQQLPCKLFFPNRCCKNGEQYFLDVAPAFAHPLSLVTACDQFFTSESCKSPRKFIHGKFMQKKQQQNLPMHKGLKICHFAW